MCIRDMDQTANFTADLILLDANGNTLSKDKYDQLSLSAVSTDITVPVLVLSLIHI